MTKQPISDHGAKISTALAARSEAASDVADRRLADRKRGKRGRYVATITDDQWDDALERIENGDLTSNVMKAMGVHRSAIIDKCDRDPEFKARYDKAIVDGYFALAEDIRNVTRGVEGYSSGDVRRDELIAKYDLALAKALVPRLADKALIEARTIQITIDPNSDLSRI